MKSYRTTPAEWVEIVRKDCRKLQFAPPHIQDDESVVLEAVKSNGLVLCWASSRLRANEDVVLQAVQSHGYAFKYAHTSLQSDKRVVLKAGNCWMTALQFASKELRVDRDVLLFVYNKMRLGKLTLNESQVAAAHLAKLPVKPALASGERYVFSVKYDEKTRTEPPYAREAAQMLTIRHAYNPNKVTKRVCGNKECLGRADGDNRRRCRRRCCFFTWFGKPNRCWCWKASFRWHLQVHKLMLQIVEGGELGSGQLVEEEMAHEMGVHICRIHVSGRAIGENAERFWQVNDVADKNVIAKGEIVAKLLEEKILEVDYSA